MAVAKYSGGVAGRRRGTMRDTVEEDLRVDLQLLQSAARCTCPVTSQRARVVGC